MESGHSSPYVFFLLPISSETHRYTYSLERPGGLVTQLDLADSPFHTADRFHINCGVHLPT